MLIAPAMNTAMWEHPITSIQINTLKSWGFIEIPVISKKLMCGDTGKYCIYLYKNIIIFLHENF